MTNKIDSKLIKKYSDHVVNKGGEILFPPDIALLYIDDLAANNATIYGMAVWKWVQLLDGTVGLYDDWNRVDKLDVPQEILDGENASVESCNTLKQLIKQLPDLDEIPFVTIYYDID